MIEARIEEVISILYAIFGFMILSTGYVKLGCAFLIYAVLNNIYVIWFAVKARKAGSKIKS